MTQLFHQLGHRYKWNIESFSTENTGNGLIIAPRYMSYDYVNSMNRQLKRNSIFDPQFYLPNSDRGYLQTYPFFPNVLAEGFSTAEWNVELAKQSAEDCLAFQNDCDFQYIVIPTRYHSTPSDFIELQTNLFVEPFLNVYSSKRYDKPCLLQLILTDNMLKDEQNRNDLLNWITGLENIAGVYLIYYLSPRHKQIDDIDFLISVMLFIRALKVAKMTIVLGYLNTESIPLLVCDPDIVTMGSYENLRMFSLRSFQEAESEQRGPNARIYVSKLLQWIDHQYIGIISKKVEDPKGFFDDTEYRVAMFQPTYNWHFSKSEPYKHYFVSFAREFERLLSCNASNRFSTIQDECRKAIQYYEYFDKNGIIFEQDSSGRHISYWLTALNQYKKILESE